MPRKVQRIDDLVIDEVSVVGKGANQHAAVTIAKSADGEKEKTMEIFDEQGNPLDVDALEHGDVVFDSDGEAYLFELDDAEGIQETEEKKEPAKVGKSFTFPKKAEPVREPVKKTSFADDIREELSKALSDKDRDEIISKALGAVDHLTQEVAKAREAAETERRVRLEREYTEIAKSYNLPIEDSVLGGVLMRCAENLSKEDCEIISKCMEAAGEAIFDEYGATGGGDNADVYSQVSAHLDSEIAKSGGTNREELMANFFAEHPELYDEYNYERG